MFGVGEEMVIRYECRLKCEEVWSSRMWQMKREVMKWWRDDERLGWETTFHPYILLSSLWVLIASNPFRHGNRTAQEENSFFKSQATASRFNLRVTRPLPNHSRIVWWAQNKYVSSWTSPSYSSLSVNADLDEVQLHHYVPRRQINVADQSDLRDFSPSQTQNQRLFKSNW